MSAFKDRLSKMNESWQTSREETSGAFNEAFEDGVYAFQLQSLALRESNANGELMAVAEHYCLEGEPAGEVYTNFFNLEKEKDGKLWGQIFLAQLVEALGYETPENMEDLEENLQEVADAAPKYTARVKTSKDGYKNLSIIRVTEQQADFEGERAAEEEAPAEAAPAAEKAAAPAEAAPEDNGSAALLEFCEAWDIKPEGAGREAILAELNAFEWKADDLTAEEAQLLDDAGVTVKTTAPPKPKPKAKPKPKPKAPAGKAGGKRPRASRGR